MWSNKLKISSPLVIVRIMVILVTGIFLSSFLYNSALARERDREDVDLFKFGFYLSPVGFIESSEANGTLLRLNGLEYLVEKAFYVPLLMLEPIVRLIRLIRCQICGELSPNK